MRTFTLWSDPGQIGEGVLWSDGHATARLAEGYLYIDGPEPRREVAAWKLDELVSGLYKHTVRQRGIGRSGERLPGVELRFDDMEADLRKRLQ